jgi:hypothetical protein
LLLIEGSGGRGSGKKRARGPRHGESRQKGSSELVAKAIDERSVLIPTGEASSISFASLSPLRE